MSRCIHIHSLGTKKRNVFNGFILNCSKPTSDSEMATAEPVDLTEEDNQTENDVDEQSSQSSVSVTNKRSPVWAYFTPHHVEKN